MDIDTFHWLEMELEALSLAQQKSYSRACKQWQHEITTSGLLRSGSVCMRIARIAPVITW